MIFRRGLAIGGDGIGLGLAASFYFWILSGPKPADAAIVQTSQPGVLSGLPSAVMCLVPAGVVLAALLSVRPGSRIWLGRLTLASCGLYLASATAAVGPSAHTIAAAAALAALLVLFVRDDAPSGGAALLVVHAGGFGTAVAFFEQWATYRAGWAPLMEQLSAMTHVWLGR